MTEPAQMDVVRRLAAFELERTSDSRRALIEEHSAAFRWLIASLLAVNGGAVLSTKELIINGNDTALFAAGSFVMGVLSALLAGWLSQKANRSLLKPLAESSSFWIEVIETGDLNERRLSKILEDTEIAVRSAWPTQLSGWLSAFGFLIGMVLFGVALVA